MQEKIKKCDNINIGANIRAIRKKQRISQTELVAKLQLKGISITREALVKIENGRQHINAAQLLSIRDALNTTYDELIK